MKVTSANSTQTKAITSLINSAFRKAESFFIEGDRIDVESVRALMGKGQFLILDNHGHLKGCVYVERRGERAYLGLLAVDPQLQNSGIGSALMKAAEDQCRRKGCRFMDLKIVNLRTDTHAFYSHRGYQETGTEQFPSHLTPKLPCHFVTMSKPLL